MDIAGAKALKKRLGPNRTDETPPVSVDVPEDAAPVFHWTGMPPAAGSAERDDSTPPPGRASLFNRLSLSLASGFALEEAFPIHVEHPCQPFRERNRPWPWHDCRRWPERRCRAC